jgi:hypothetical protein
MLAYGGSILLVYCQNYHAISGTDIALIKARVIIKVEIEIVFLSSVMIPLILILILS